MEGSVSSPPHHHAHLSEATPPSSSLLFTLLLLFLQTLLPQLPWSDNSFIKAPFFSSHSFSSSLSFSLFSSLPTFLLFSYHHLLLFLLTCTSFSYLLSLFPSISSPFSSPLLLYILSSPCFLPSPLLFLFLISSPLVLYFLTSPPLFPFLVSSPLLSYFLSLFPSISSLTSSPYFFPFLLLYPLHVSSPLSPLLLPLLHPSSDSYSDGCKALYCIQGTVTPSHYV